MFFFTCAFWLDFSLLIACLILMNEFLTVVCSNGRLWSITGHLSSDGCVDDKREDYQRTAMLTGAELYFAGELGTGACRFVA